MPISSTGHLVVGASSTTIRRRLNNGAGHRIVKVAHRPADLEQQLAELGWAVTVTATSESLYWGAGGLA